MSERNDAYVLAKVMLIQGEYPTPTKLNIALGRGHKNNLNGEHCAGRAYAFVEAGYIHHDGRRPAWIKP